MLYHVVLLKLKPGASAAEVALARDAVVGLRDRIPGIRAIDWGPNTSPEGLGQGHDVGFVVVFQDATARDAYLPHPAHRAVVPSIQAVAETVLVFDLEGGLAETGSR